MSCCITSRQLHNSPIYTPSFASGHIHTFSHAAQLAQNKQSQHGPSGDKFLFDVRCFWWQVIWLFVHGHGRGRMKTMSVLWASWKHECCSCKIHLSEQRGEQLLCWIINKSSVCTAGYVHVCRQVCLLIFFLQRPQSPSLVKATLELPASRGRSKSSTCPRRRAARSGLTPVLHDLLKPSELPDDLFVLY